MIRHATYREQDSASLSKNPTHVVVEIIPYPCGD